MTWSIERKVIGAFSVALISLGLVGTIGYMSMTNFIKSSRWAAHAQGVLTELDDVPLQMERAESEQQRYLLTDDESYREAYQKAASGVEKELNDLRHLTANNPAQKERLDTLATLTKQRLASLQEIVNAQDTEGADDALQTMLTNGGTVTREDIQKTVQDMEADENRRLARHSAAATAHARRMRRLMATGGILALTLVGLAGVAVNRDILKRKQAEAALQESEARYRTLVENANEGIIAITLDGKIASVNHGLETMLNWSREELIGESYGKILTPTSATQGEERLRHALAVDRLPSAYEAESVRKDGSVVPVDIHASFLRDGAGQIAGILAIHRDISVRKALEQSKAEGRLGNGITPS